MRHLRKSSRFGRKPSHRKSMFRNMVTSLFVHERILTTLDRAKELRRVAEKLITIGKRGDLAARRLAARTLRTTGEKDGKRLVQKNVALQKLFDTLAPRYTDRPGGYTRIVRTGRRPGDNAPMAFLELLPEERKAAAPAKKGKKKPAKKAEGATKKPTPKAKGAAKDAAAKKTAKKPAKKKPAKKKTDE